MKVNIYTATSVKGPKKQNGKLVYILEAVKDDGSTATKTGFGEIQDMSRNSAELLAVVEALRKLKDPEVEVHFYMDSPYVSGVITQQWIQKWQENGWKTVRGDEIRNADLWKEFFELTKCRKTLIFPSEENSYQNWMSWMAEKPLVESEKR